MLLAQDIASPRLVSGGSSFALLLLISVILLFGTLGAVRLFSGKHGQNRFGKVFVGIAAAVAVMVLLAVVAANLQPNSSSPGFPGVRDSASVSARLPNEAYNTVLVNPAGTIQLRDANGRRSTVQVGPGYVTTYGDSQPTTSSHASTSTRSTFGLVLIFPLTLIVLFALWRHFNGYERHSDDRPSAWGSVGTILAVLFFGMTFFWFSSFKHSGQVAHMQQAQTVAKSRLAAVRDVEEQRASASIDELHEQLTEPRIKLEDTTEEAAGKPTVQESSLKAENATEGKTPTTAKLRAAPPAWVTNPPKRTGSVTRRVVSAGPYKTTSECYRQIERRLEEAVRAHLQELVRGQPALRHGYVSNLRRYNISTETILRKLCPPDGEHIEVRDTSVGEMKTLHVLMEFGPEQDAFLLKQWSAYERIERIFVISVFAGLIFAAIALVWGLLWLDTYTRGYYTKRLFLGVPAAIIGGICLIALIGEMM